jgi:hypothetical protein
MTTVNKQIAVGSGGETSVELAVAIDGLDITIPAGSVTLEGEVYAVTEQVVSVTPDPTYSSTVEIMLAHDGAGLVLLVDENTAEFPEAVNSLAGGTYRLLWMLVQAYVPPGVSDLSTATVHIFTSVAQ